MPLFNSYTISEHCLWGIWQIEEDEPTLLRLLNEKMDKAEFEQIRDARRRVQWLAARALASTLYVQINGYQADGIFQEECYICKDEYGKPMLKNLDWHISLAHCSMYAVAILHKTQAVGIDIEEISPKIRRVIARICTSEELAWAGDSLSNFSILWCSKEAMYKYYGKKKLDFKKEIRISENASKGTINTDEGCKKMTLLHNNSLENYQIVVCL